MRSALAGTANNVMALKTTAAVPMSVIERMFHLPWVSATTMHDQTAFLEKAGSINFETRNVLSSLRNISHTVSGEYREAAGRAPLRHLSRASSHTTVI
jgi:hypothetical protein